MRCPRGQKDLYKRIASTAKGTQSMCPNSNGTIVTLYKNYFKVISNYIFSIALLQLSKYSFKK